MNVLKKMTVALAFTSAFVAARAAPIVLTFEGIGNNAPVSNFYSAQGITFSPATLALVDSDSGGSGSFANEPSAGTVMFFTSANNAILNFASGFSTGFSFFYSSSTAASVRLYDKVNGTGNLLGSLDLTAQYTDNCDGDPTGTFCNWSAIGVTFAGIAQSIDFGGTADQTAFDDITFGSKTPGNQGNQVPEPASLLLVGLALASMAAVRRRRAVAL